MIPLKQLSAAAIPRALEKAERYRLINQPWDAESICLDILAVDPDREDARRMLLLACTDQFRRGAAGGQAVDRAREALTGLTGAYERAYYAGVIAERLALARLEQRIPGAGFLAHELLQEAMERYQEAEALRPEGNDDAILRWNTCARLMNESPHVVAGPVEDVGVVLGE
jgi:hypothetical protein